MNVPLDKSVKVIHHGAFSECEDMDVCEMHDGIEEIGDFAFNLCRNLKRIKLSKNLKRIEFWAFKECYSLHAVFIPSNIEKIAQFAFHVCRNMRVLLSLPQNITPQQIGIAAFLDCYRLYHAIDPQFLKDEHFKKDYCEMNKYYNDVIHPSIIDNCHDQPPLHQACLDMEVSAQTIKDCAFKHMEEILHVLEITMEWYLYIFLP